MDRPATISHDTVVERVEGLLSAAVGTDVVVLHLEKNAYFDANAVGAEIWRELEQPRTVGSLVALLVAKYDVGAEDCRADVEKYLTQCLDAGLVRVVEGRKS
ncbi:MAG: PqqD family protein [Acidobacteria bacterium]|jgi:hypothetical protein|nr:PqqD family protein [Acidobacteriota bacterium]